MKNPDVKIIMNSCGKKGCFIKNRVLPQLVIRPIFKRLLEEVKED